jgi:hypothetical protein
MKRGLTFGQAFLLMLLFLNLVGEKHYTVLQILAPWIIEGFLIWVWDVLKLFKLDERYNTWILKKFTQYTRWRLYRKAGRMLKNATKAK